jgi:hypothetical protein
MPRLKFLTATVANMRRVTDQHGVAVLDRSTWELSSASPGDYFMTWPEAPFRNAEGRVCVLVAKRPTTLEPVFPRERPKPHHADGIAAEQRQRPHYDNEEHPIHDP